jgi:4-hydroxymandelate oxidase
VTQQRLMRTDERTCSACHAMPPSTGRFFVTRPIFSGIDVTKAVRLTPNDWSWEYVDRLRSITRMNIVLKGIVAREDAELARQHKVDGLIVSNHGGRAEDSGRSTIDALPEILEAVDGRIPVLVDSGFRRGTDIAKALALGARAVCIGRPYLWGLGAFGQPGVERVLELLQQETRAAMMQLGAPSLKHLVPAMVRRA